MNGGALLDYRTRDGLTAMHRAVQADNLQAVRTLLGESYFQPTLHLILNILILFSMKSNYITF